MYKATLLVVTLLALTFASTASAQQADTPFFSSGPTIQTFKIYRERSATGDSDWTVGVLSAGAGYSFNFNIGCPCKVAWFTVGIPVYLAYTSSTQNFNFGPAISVGTYNNLISLALGYSMFDIEQNLPSIGWALCSTHSILALIWEVAPHLLLHPLLLEDLLRVRNPRHLPNSPRRRCSFALGRWRHVTARNSAPPCSVASTKHERLDLWPLPRSAATVKPCRACVRQPAVEKGG